jgi:hypothetical protein
MNEIRNLERFGLVLSSPLYIAGAIFLALLATLHSGVGAKQAHRR